MRSETRFTMISPSAGFTARVMTRIEARERAQARRRAVIGAGLLVAAAVALFTLIAIWFASLVGSLLSNPAAIAATVQAVLPVVDLLDAFRVAAFAILRNVNGMILLAYALGVLVLTTLWAEIATGTFRFPLTILAGGQRK